MEEEYQYATIIKPYAKFSRTYVGLDISAAEVFRNIKQFDWPSYVRACRERLHRVAAQSSIEIVVWSVDLDHERASIFHHILARGWLQGTLPLSLARALRPPPGYWHLDFLERGLRRGWHVEPILKAEVKLQQLQRYDRNGKRLEEPIPEQLLARALTETNWRLLISPSDSPWAYINTATQRIYERQYQTTDTSESDGNEYDRKLSYERVETGDELQIEDLPGLWRAAGVTEDLIRVLLARAEGVKWRELPEYLTERTGELFDQRRVEAIRGKLRTLKRRLRAAGMAASQWKPRSADGTVYRERVPDGGPWFGRWTYAHKYSGEELEVLGDLARQEWIKLFREQ
jgi:hypothetical protein